MRRAIFWLLLAFQPFPGSGFRGVWFKEDPIQPVDVLFAVVHAGSAVEEPGTEGMTHLLEHLLFDGTRTRSRTELRDEFQALGALVNAFTRQDYVAFFAVTPPDGAPRAATLLCEMLAQSTIPESEWEKEKRVVLEELLLWKNQGLVEEPDYLAFVFEGTPYAWRVLGTRESLDALTREQVTSFYRRIVRPERISWLFLGPSARALAEWTPQCAALWPERTEDLRPPTVRSVPSVLRVKVQDEAASRLRVVLRAQGSLPGTSLLARLLEQNWQDAYPRWRPWARSMNIEGQTLRYGSFVEWDITLQEVPSLEELRRLVRNLLEPEAVWKDWEAVVQEAYTEFLYFTENPTYFGMWLAGQVGLDLSPEEALRQWEVLRRADPRALWSQLTADPLLRALLETTQETFAAGDYPLTPEPSLQWRTLPGITVIVEELPGVVISSAVLLAPKRLLYEHRPGVSDLYFRLLTRTLRQQLKDLAAEVEGAENPYIVFDDWFYSPDFGLLRLRAPSAVFPQVWQRFTDFLKAPRFTADDLNAVLQEAQQSWAIYRTRARWIAENTWRRALPIPFGHPFPAPDEAGEYDLTDLVRYHQQLWSSNALILAVSGTLSWDEVTRNLPVLETSTTLLPEVGFPSLPDYQFVPLSSSQTTFLLLAPIRGAEAEEWILLARWLQQVLTEELREKRGLTYSVSVSAELLSVVPHLKIRFSSSAERAPEAYAALQQLLPELGASLGASSLRLAVAGYRGQHLRYHQRTVNRAFLLARAYALTGDPGWDLGHLERLAALTPGLLRERWLQVAGRWKWVVVGPEDPRPQEATD